jgi:hypothetical protein
MADVELPVMAGVDFPALAGVDLVAYRQEGERKADRASCLGDARKPGGD